MEQERVEEKMKELENKLKYSFKDINLLAEAMKSEKLPKKGTDGTNAKDYSNERMAFLGDTILKFLIAEELYDADENARKGDLTDKKMCLEKNAVLSKIMDRENLRPYTYNQNYFYGDNCPDHEKVVSNKHDPYIEAIVAAIYKDSDYSTVKEWFRGWLLPLLKKHKGE